MQEQPTPVTQPAIKVDPQRILEFVDRLTLAQTVTDVNIAAGTFGNELRGIDELVTQETDQGIF